MDLPEKQKKALLQKWLDGEMGLREEQQLEQLADEDAFLQEALDGYRSTSEENHRDSIASIKNRLQNRNKKSRSILVFMPRVAAAIAVLLVSALSFWWLNQNTDTELANQQAPKIVPREEKAPASPSQLAENTIELKEEKTQEQQTKSEKVETQKKLSPSVKRKKKRSNSPVVTETETFEAEVVEDEISFVYQVDESDQQSSILLPQEEQASEARDLKLTKDAVAKKDKETARLEQADRPVQLFPITDTLQRTTIKGLVTNDIGEPLIGATIAVVNSSTNTFTDFNGYFAIALADTQRDKLEISYQGYENKTIAIAKQDNLNIILQEKPALLDVVKNYQTEEYIAESKREKASKKGKAAYFINQAQPITGFKNYRVYIQKELNYPEKARNAKIEGMVQLEFTIDASGNPTNFKILKGLGYGCDEEAMFLIENGPKWAGEGRVTYEVEFKLDR